MKSFKEILGKPSVAMQAMLDGMRDVQTGEADMDSSSRDFAALCAVQRVSVVQLDMSCIFDFNTRFARLDCDRYDLRWFETAVESFSRGEPFSLFCYFGQSKIYGEKIVQQQDWMIKPDNWRKHLPKVEQYISRCVAAGY